MQQQIERWIRRRDRKNAGMVPRYVCKRYAGITQVHHLVPISILKTLLNHGDSLGVNVNLSYETVSLCPNHHAMLHLAYDRNLFLSDAEEYEIEAIEKLMEMQSNLINACADDIIQQIEKVRHASL